MFVLRSIEAVGDGRGALSIRARYDTTCEVCPAKTSQTMTLPFYDRLPLGELDTAARRLFHEGTKNVPVGWSQNGVRIHICPTCLGE